MKSFKNYAEKTSSGARQSENVTEQSVAAEELTQKIAAAYNGKSNADMLRGILAEAEKSKRAGTLSNEEIENFYQTFSPMLDNAQRKKLRVIVERLKKI